MADERAAIGRKRIDRTRIARTDEIIFDEIGIGAAVIDERKLEGLRDRPRGIHVPEEVA